MTTKALFLLSFLALFSISAYACPDKDGGHGAKNCPEHAGKECPEHEKKQCPEHKHDQEKAKKCPEHKKSDA